MSGEPDTAETRARQMSANPKSRKRMRIWFDESEEEEALGKASEETAGGIYGIAPEQLIQPQENRGETNNDITGTAMKGQRSGDVVSMVLAPSSTKMSVHEKAYFSPYHSSQLLSKLADLWRMGKMCDATVCIGFTIRIKAHKLVLSSMSSVVMNMASKTDGAVLELQLPGDLNVDSVQKFITFLYEGVLYLSATTVFDIQRLATMFKVDSVLGYCQTFLQNANIQHTLGTHEPVQTSGVPSLSHTPVPIQPTPNPVPYQLVAPLNTALNTTSLGASLAKGTGTTTVHLLRNSLKQSSTGSTDSVSFPKRPILRQQATVHGEDDLPQYHKHPRDPAALLASKRVQELKGLWKKESSETSDDISSPGLTGTDHMLGSPLEMGSVKDSPSSSFDQIDVNQVKTEPDDSATESGDEHNPNLPPSVMFCAEVSEGMDPPDVPSLGKTRTKGPSSEQSLGNRYQLEENVIDSDEDDFLQNLDLDLDNVENTVSDTRFAHFSTEQIDKIQSAKDEKSTKSLTRWGVKLFKEWLTCRGLSTEFQNLLPQELNEKLRQFYVEARTKSGKEYSKSALLATRAAINRFLQAPPFKRTCNIMKDRVFNSSNHVLMGVLKEHKRQGKDTQHKEPISREDLRKLYDSDHMSVNTPKSLVQKVWFDLMFHFGRRGCEGLQNLHEDSFSFGKDDTGCEYVTLSYNEADKNHHGKESRAKHKNVRMYASGDVKCPVESLQLYLSKRSPSKTAFFQRPLVNPKGNCWYANQAIGIKSLGNMMADISRDVGLSRRYTNRCIRATCVTVLNDAGVDVHGTMSVTGHRNEASLRSYVQRPSVEQHRS